MSSPSTLDRPDRAAVLEAQNQFLIPLGIALAAVLVIHALPKFVPSPVRLVYLLVYFAAWLRFLYQWTLPWRKYSTLLFRWRFDGAPDPIERASKSLVFSLNQVIAFPCLILMTFLSSVLLMVLTPWFPELQCLAGVYRLVWWLSLFAFLLFPFAGGFLFNEVAQKLRMLSHELELSRSFRPRSFGDLYSQEEDGEPQPLEILERGKFRAGGMTWDWNDFVQNCVVFGQIGSGKTSCVLNSILDGLLGSAAQANQSAGGLILDPKGTFAADVQALCRRYGRTGDLLIIDPDDPESITWNPFDSTDDEYEIAMRFAAVCRSVGTKDENSSFWITKATMFIQYAIELIRATNDEHDPPSFDQINELANGFDAIARRAAQVDPTDPQLHQCLRFFATEWALVGSELRTSVQAFLTNMLNPFLKEPFLTRFAGRSTMRISEMIDQGKIIYLHMPTADRETMARVIGIFLKLEYYREILKRPRKKNPTFFFCDEFQKFFTAGSKDNKEQEKSDADTFRLSRESYHANIVATQNLGALGDLEVAKAFLGNCLTGIYLRNPDDDTNQFASKLFSQELMGMSSSMQGGGAGKLRPMGGQQLSVNDQMMDRLPPHRFRELAICSRDQRSPHCESIVFLGGRGEYPIPIRTLKWKRHPLSV